MENCSLSFENATHNEDENIKINEKLMKDHEDVIEKLFLMMDNFTNQIVKMKETNNLK